MLESGTTQVCEFQYVQHQPDGMRYAAAMPASRSRGRAGQRGGIGGLGGRPAR